MAENKTENKVENKEVRIDGEIYEWDKLSEDARKHVNNIRIADEEISRMKRHVAMMETARSSYAMLLKKALAKDEKPEKATH